MKLDPDTLDLGIKDLVLELNRRGWNTTDSGDGVSKFDPDYPFYDPEAIPFPHVVIRPGCTPSRPPAQSYVTAAFEVQSLLDEIAPEFIAELIFWPKCEEAIIFCSNTHDPTEGVSNG